MKFIDETFELAGVEPRMMDPLPRRRKEVYCEDCGSDQPMVEHQPRKDELNPYPWYDITCGTCYSIIATVQIVPDDKPLEPSNAVE